MTSSAQKPDRSMLGDDMKQPTASRSLSTCSTRCEEDMSTYGAVSRVSRTSSISSRRASDDDAAGSEGDEKSKIDANVDCGRVYPWCLLPDAAWYTIGSLLLLLAIPSLIFVLFSVFVQQIVWPRILAPALPASLLPSLEHGIDRVARACAPYVLKDERNAPYLPWMAFILTFAPLIFSTLMWHYIHVLNPLYEDLSSTPGSDMSTYYLHFFGSFFVYHCLRLGPQFRLYAYHHVLAHKESHSRTSLWKFPWLTENVVAKNINQLFFGHLLYGAIPFSLRTSHLKFHHYNDKADYTTSVDLDRTKPSSFLLFLPRWYAYYTAVSPIFMFHRRGDAKNAQLLSFGLLIYLTQLGVVVHLAGWMFALAYVIFPFIEATTFMAVIVYVWHFCVNPEDPECEYVNSITIVNGRDNIWGEDYHALHHYAGHLHWSLLADRFQATKDVYEEKKATLFTHTEAGEIGFWILTAQHDKLASHFLDLSGKLTHEEKKELLLRRMRYRHCPVVG